MLPQNSPIKLNLTQPRPYPRCQSFFIPVVGSENWGSGDDVQTSIFSPELSKHCSRNRHSSIWQHFAPFLHITAPRAVMSNYENKQIPQKTGLATYLISKSHGSAVGNCRDGEDVFPARYPIAASPLNFAANNRKKNPLAPRIPRPRITRKIKWSIDHLHNGVILLLWTEFLSFFLSHLNLQWILARFK